ncbi:metallophosphoesterase family protein [Candidatus Woesearchaeota archaeon]|nr:metallophosphoesterase family protein [Candidatus Woesearchaeota archaeon]
MKIFAFTDTHGSRSAMMRVRRASARADLIACAGDITIFQRNLHAVLRQLNQLGKRILLIPGNHESVSVLRNACRGYKNITDLHQRMQKIGDILFIGHGSGGFSLASPEFEALVRKEKGRIAAAQKIVLLIHQPPFGSRADRIEKAHTGNKSYRDFISRHQPALVICGHLHENFRVQDKLGKSIIINPGPAGKMLKV